jgi:hypothetical protein
MTERDIKSGSRMPSFGTASVRPLAPQLVFDAVLAQVSRVATGEDRRPEPANLDFRGRDSAA